MTHDELEFSISQYLDGTLPALEKAALEDRLAKDAEARALLSEYQKLQGVLMQSRVLHAPPALDWDKLADQIKRDLADEEAPIRNYSISSHSWLRWASGVAAAAVVAFAVGVAVYVSRPAPRITDGSSGAAGAIHVAGPAAETATSPAIAQVSVGPADELTQSWRTSQTIVTRPPRVVIASGYNSAQYTPDSNGLY